MRMLVIDDDQAICELIADIAEPLGFEVSRAYDGAAFREAYRIASPQIIVLDLRLPGEDGIELLQHLSAAGFGGQLILLSGAGPRVLETTKRLATSLGLTVLGYLDKPFIPGTLVALLAGLTASPKVLNVDAERLKEAIADGCLFLEYQPKYALARDRTIQLDSVEALVRWRHSREGVIPPGRFVPLAEASSELAFSLTSVVLAQVMEQARAWNRAGSCLPIAVNIPGILVADPELPNLIDRLIDEFDVAPSQLILEVTETGFLSDMDGAIAALTRLRLKGFGLALDDFGTGYSSLTQLYRIPFDEVKIDKSFVMEAEGSAEAQVIIRSTVELAHNLGISACAEGVENSAVLDLLRSWGCDKAQGYHLGKPAMPDQVPSWSQISRGGLLQPVRVPPGSWGTDVALEA